MINVGFVHKQGLTLLQLSQPFLTTLTPVPFQTAAFAEFIFDYTCLTCFACMNETSKISWTCLQCLTVS